MAYQVANYCTEQCGLSNKRELRISRLARKGVYCLTFIDNYELSQCRPEDLQQAIWRLEDLWLEAGFESKQILWHTSGTQATRKGTIAVRIQITHHFFMTEHVFFCSVLILVLSCSHLARPFNDMLSTCLDG